jgi:hypothetical protein
MRKSIKLWILVLASLWFATPGRGDDVQGVDRLLCTSVQATRCSMDGDCVVGPPWNWNIPQFIEVDLVRMSLSTTKASGELRSTPIRYKTREGGMLFLQGVERGRAFSVVITEETGMFSGGVATEGLAVSIFGACTPISPTK